MSAEKAVYSILSGNAPLAAVIGTRIFPAGGVPDEETNNLPLVTYSLISKIRSHRPTSDSGTHTARIQFDCFGRSYDEAKQVVALVASALSRKAGSYGGVNVQDIALENEFDQSDPDSSFFWVSVDALVFIQP